MKKLNLMLVALFGLPVFAFAQDGDAGGLDLDLKAIVAVMITGVGIPLAVQILKHFWDGAPAWVKTIVPVVVPGLLVTLGGLASDWLGHPIDFQDIIDIITTTTGIGLAATTAFKMGKKDA